MSEQKKATHVAVPLEVFESALKYLEDRSIKEAGPLYSAFLKCQGVAIEEQPKLQEAK